jgi:hypothetical protein
MGGLCRTHTQVFRSSEIQRSGKEVGPVDSSGINPAGVVLLIIGLAQRTLKYFPFGT